MQKAETLLREPCKLQNNQISRSCIAHNWNCKISKEFDSYIVYIPQSMCDQHVTGWHLTQSNVLKLKILNHKEAL